MSDIKKAEINAAVKDIIRRSDLKSANDSPETVAALMVVTVCRHLGVPHENIPATLLRALSDLG